MAQKNYTISECIGIIGVHAFAVYVCLATNADEYSETTISYDAMQQQLDLSRGTVSNSLKILISHGLITMRRRFSASSVYRISLPDELMDSPLVYLVNCISLTSGRFNSLSLINNESIKREYKRPLVELMDTTISLSNEPMVKNGSFSLSDAQALLMQLTGWMRIPGNPTDAEHALGAVQDIHTKHKDNTIEYLRPFWQAFRERYPRSTQIFWLVDWAVQGVIPEKTKKKAPAGVNIPPTEYTAEAKKAAAREEFARQKAKLEAKENADK